MAEMHCSAPTVDVARSFVILFLPPDCVPLWLALAIKSRAICYYTGLSPIWAPVTLRTFRHRAGVDSYLVGSRCQPSIFQGMTWAKAPLKARRLAAALAEVTLQDAAFGFWVPSDFGGPITLLNKSQWEFSTQETFSYATLVCQEMTKVFAWLQRHMSPELLKPQHATGTSKSLPLLA